MVLGLFWICMHPIVLGLAQPRQWHAWGFNQMNPLEIDGQLDMRSNSSECWEFISLWANPYWLVNWSWVLTEELTRSITAGALAFFPWTYTASVFSMGRGIRWLDRLSHMKTWVCYILLFIYNTRIPVNLKHWTMTPLRTVPTTAWPELA